MGIDWTHQLAEQLDRHWRRQLRPRYDGLTDAEYFWEPVANTWNIRPRGHGRAAIAAGGGDFIIDYAYPEPTPAPVTTIAWRLAHLIVSVFGTRVADHFGGPPVDDLAFNYAGTAAQALRQLDDVYAAWLAGVKSLGEAGLARPCGPAEGPLAEYPMATLVLHINREALHHGAEIALLRDLYANRLPISRRPASRLGGSIYSCPTSGDRTATGKSPEQRQKRAFTPSLMMHKYTSRTTIRFGQTGTAERSASALITARRPALPASACVRKRSIWGFCGHRCRVWDG